MLNAHMNEELVMCRYECRSSVEVKDYQTSHSDKQRSGDIRLLKTLAQVTSLCNSSTQAAYTSKQ